MKVAFFSINFTFGALGLILGLATLLSATHSASFAAAAVGIGAVSLAVICLTLCKDCVIAHLKERGTPSRTDIA